MDVREFIKLCNECEPLFESPRNPGKDPACELGRLINNDYKDTSPKDLLSEIRDPIKNQKSPSDNLVFIYMLKKEVENGGRYEFDLKDAQGNAIRAEVDPFDPFGGENGEQLNQKWHVLISLLAYCDIAHKLSDPDNEDHDLYKWVDDYDLGELQETTLFLNSKRPSITIGPKNYTSAPMMRFIKKAVQEAPQG